MVSDDLCAVSWRARPGSFVGLMTLYESNYIRLGWLVGDLRTLSGEHRSAVNGDPELKLCVLEHGPYTTMLSLTYAFDRARESQDAPDSPDLAIRVYHDARVAEASSVGQDVTRVVRRTGSEVTAERLGPRWSRNMLLNKWLEYCVDRGHRFGAVGG